MANIYIKSFNRPFYLDRCIRSVKLNATGYDRIIVLDDGTLKVYLDRIQSWHPDVEIRSSGADDGKIALLREERFDEIAKRYPSAVEFWVSEIGKDSETYCVILEDDVWFCRHVDLPLLERNLRENEAAICKFWWGDYQHSVAMQYEAPGCPPIEYVEPDIQALKQAQSIWIVAFAMFRRDYWLHCVTKAKRLGDERSQLTAACEFAASHLSVRFAKTAKRCVHQGWMVPARSTPEYYDRGLKQHVYMDVLNDAWMAGKLDPALGYPLDFDRAAILGVLTSVLTEDQVAIWDEWHRREIRYQYDG
jgi:hypothetical protein